MGRITPSGPGVPVRPWLSAAYSRRLKWRWIDTHRGLLVGVLAAGSATGQLLFLPVGAWLIEHVGWRMAVMPVLVSCALVAMLACLCMRDRPQEVGLRAHGAGRIRPLMLAYNPALCAAGAACEAALLVLAISSSTSPASLALRYKKSGCSRPS